MSGNVHFSLSDVYNKQPMRVYSENKSYQKKQKHS